MAWILFEIYVRLVTLRLFVVLLMWLWKLCYIEADLNQVCCMQWQLNCSIYTILKLLYVRKFKSRFKMFWGYWVTWDFIKHPRWNRRSWINAWRSFVTCAMGLNVMEMLYFLLTILNDGDVAVYLLVLCSIP